MNTSQAIAENQDSGRVKITPWYRGLGRRDSIYLLWRMMDEEDATKYVFYGQELAPEDEKLRGDLVDFCRFFEPVIGDWKQILMFQDKACDFMGYGWFEKIELGVRANYGVFVRRKYWGSMAREASRKAFEWGFAEEGLAVKEIIAYSPWRWAISHGEWLGMKIIDVIPHICILDNVPRRIQVRGKPLDVTVLKITREEFYGKSKT